MSSEDQTKPSNAGIEPLVVRPRAAKVMLGDISDEKLFQKIVAGELESYLDGRRRLITVKSIKADIARNLAAAAERGFEYARNAWRPGRTKAAPASARTGRRARRREEAT